MIGKTISHYKITEKLGEGGMGEVYLAEDTDLQRKVAIKFLPKHLTGNENIQRFKRETQAAAALNHPNIVTIHEIAEHDDQIFIIMEYVEGKSLRDVINEYQLSTDKVIDIITQISEGLKEAHRAGIVHRDIKPENIIVDRSGRVRILDFGLAKLKGVSKLTSDSSTLGTVQYMSPEQIQGQEIDQRSDIWSIGVLLCELLSGVPPFKGDYDTAVQYAILNEEPDTLNEKIPESIIQLVNKCLRKKPEDRYQKNEELISDLNNVKDRESKNNGENKILNKKIKYTAIAAVILILILLGYFIFPINKLNISDTEITGWENSIAVLPFADLSPNKDQEFFCYGVTEQLLTNLSQNKRLKVIARTSVMKYKNTEKSVLQIGKELHVDNVLEGSASNIGDRVRIHAQLIRTEDQSHLWSRHYDYAYDIDSVFAIYDDISEKIADHLLTTLTPIDKETIRKNRPNSTEAYEYYMKGLYFHYNKYSMNNEIDDFLIAEKMFKHAIRLDPDFGDYYASLVDLYNSVYNRLQDSSSDKSKYMLLQEAYLDTALKLNPNSAEVHYVQACVYDAKNEPEKFFNSIKTAIKINPNNDRYYHQLGFFLFKKGCNHQAIKCFDKAIELNPLDDSHYELKGTQCWEIGNFNEAEISYKKALQLNPTDWGNLNLYLLLVEAKKYPEAKELLRQTISEYPKRHFRAARAIQYAIDGEKEKAMEIYNSADTEINRIAKREVDRFY